MPKAEEEEQEEVGCSKEFSACQCYLPAPGSCVWTLLYVGGGRSRRHVEPGHNARPQKVFSLHRLVNPIPLRQTRVIANIVTSLNTRVIANSVTSLNTRVIANSVTSLPEPSPQLGQGCAR